MEKSITEMKKKRMNKKDSQPDGIGIPLMEALIQELSLGKASLISCSNDYTIIKEGSWTQDVYLIESGEISVHLPGKILKVKEGGIFGENAALINAQRNATIKAKKNVKYYKIPGRVFRGAVYNNDKITSMLYQLVKERCRLSLEAARNTAERSEYDNDLKSLICDRLGSKEEQLNNLINKVVFNELNPGKELRRLESNIIVKKCKLFYNSFLRYYSKNITFISFAINKLLGKDPNKTIDCFDDLHKDLKVILISRFCWLSSYFNTCIATIHELKRLSKRSNLNEMLYLPYRRNSLFKIYIRCPSPKCNAINHDRCLVLFDDLDVMRKRLIDESAIPIIYSYEETDDIHPAKRIKSPIRQEIMCQNWIEGKKSKCNTKFFFEERPELSPDINIIELSIENYYFHKVKFVNWEMVEEDRNINIDQITPRTNYRLCYSIRSNR